LTNLARISLGISLSLDGWGAQKFIEHEDISTFLQNMKKLSKALAGDTAADGIKLNDELVNLKTIIQPVIYYSATCL
jgi:hypothetical protein